jgi:hypothetical protein
MSAVALLTATGVLETEMPVIAGQSINEHENAIAKTQQPTSPRTSRNVNIIVSSTIMANPLHRLRKLREQFFIKRSRDLSYDVNLPAIRNNTKKHVVISP